MTNRAMIVAAPLACALALAGCQQETMAPEPVRPVQSVLLEADHADDAVAVGVVEPRYKTNIGFRVLGRLTARPVYVGDLVNEGQTVAKAEAQFATVRATEERQRTLITTDATTKQTLDNAEQARAGAEATVAHAQANLTKAIEQLGYSQIKADFAGVVTAVGAEIGQVASPGQSVVTIARPDVREAVVDIGQDFPVPLEVGLPFTVSLQIAPAVQVQGSIREIAPQADPVTRLRRVRIALSNPPEGFRLGATVTAKLDKGQARILRLPASAVLVKDGANFVWTVDQHDSTASLQKIDVIADQVGARVTGGLTLGTRVVTAGIHSLKQGQRVRIEQDEKP
jgi:RND family efflux transporter MFP subunit